MEPEEGGKGEAATVRAVKSVQGLVEAGLEGVVLVAAGMEEGGLVMGVGLVVVVLAAAAKVVVVTVAMEVVAWAVVVMEVEDLVEAQQGVGE